MRKERLLEGEVSGMIGRVKIDQADRLFSIFIRYRDKWTCVRCGKQYEERDQRLQNSHYFGRRKESVRFDPENCDALCFGCHRYWEKEDREGYRSFKVRQLGQRGFDALVLRANTIVKKDRKMILLFYREELKRIGIT